MAATQDARKAGQADLSSSHSTYLSTSVEEPELNSINFQQSLRFFQDQLILNSKEFESRDTNNDTSNAFEHFLDENNPIEKHLHIDRAFDEMHKSLSNNKISIPTVDTILESVRVLRAIQKSQECRGSSWSLNISPTESKRESLSFENFEDQETNSSQILKDVLSFPKDTESLKEIESQEISPAASDETHSFWPSHQLMSHESITNTCLNDTLATKQNTADTNRDQNEPIAISILNDKKQHDANKPLNENLKNGKNFNDISEVNGCETVQEQIFFQTNSQWFSGYANISSTSDPITSDSPDRGLTCNETFSTAMSCFHEEFPNFLKEEYEIIPHNNCDSAQNDLAKETNPLNDKTENVTSLPQFIQLRPESRSDTCSSHYISAECSPCISLHGDFEQMDENNRTAYSSQRMDSENKKISFSEIHASKFHIDSDDDLEARDSSKISLSTENHLECPSSSIETYQTVDTIPANASLLETTITLEERDSSSPTPESKNSLETSLSAEEKSHTVNNGSNANTSRTNTTNGFEKTNASNSITLFQQTSAEKEEDEYKNHEVKKFTTSSWNLEAIVESLYFLPEPKLPEVIPSHTIFKKTIFVMSRGAFCKYPEGNYTLELQQQSAIISQENSVLMSILLSYADFSDEGNILTLDNKLGRCLYFKCATREELLQLKQELQRHRSKCRALERINLVHYPLKCHRNVVIIDLGSCSTRAGILMDQPTLPFIFFPSVCAIHKVTGNRVYGKEALQNDTRQNSNLSFPLRPSVKIIQHSIDVDLMDGLFKKIFHDLNVNPAEYTIQVCLPRSLSINTQNALVKLLLEDFEAKSVSLTHQALLTLYAHNVSTGIVVDIGDRMDILPVVDGFIVEKGVTRVPHGGQRLIHHMKHALAEKHISLSNDIDSFVVRFISENLTYIPEDYENETVQYPDIVRKSVGLDNFIRDDNLMQQAVLDDARFKVPEGLFKPSLWGLDNAGVHQLVQKAIQATSVDVRKKIAENIYVSGGVTTIPGFVERLLKELSILNKPRIIPKVIASKYQYHCTYIGACEFARMEVFPKVCVDAKEYKKEQLSCLKKFVLCF